MRVKGGSVTRQRRKKIIKMAKGYRGHSSHLYKRAKSQVMRSFNYQYRDRKKRKSFFRRLWIMRINGALSDFGVRYSIFIHALKLKKIIINRKMLSAAIIDSDKFLPNLLFKVLELKKR